MTSDRGRFSGIWEFIFRKIDGLRPEQAVKAIKTDLRKITVMKKYWYGSTFILPDSNGRKANIG